MVSKSIIGATCACLAIVSFNADAALVGRLAATPGSTDYQAYYDTDTNLTWLADVNAAAGSAYDTFEPGSGKLNWSDANSWAAQLNVGGITDWRLPDTVDVGNDGETFTNIYQGVDYGYNITTHSELSYMFFVTLGNSASRDISGAATTCGDTFSCLINTGPFSNLTSPVYWSATAYAAYSPGAWSFDAFSGFQGWGQKTIAFTAWAVHSGDVSAVPVPAAVWLFGFGLIGLLGLTRRKA